jgi:uncharacterized protein YbaP (TraB family)
VTEKIREIYLSPEGTAEVIFDHYPGLPPYMEIESTNDGDLKKIIKELGLDETENQNIRIGSMYKNLYKNTNESSHVLTFHNIFELDLEKDVKANKMTIFLNIVQQQRKMLNDIAQNRHRRRSSRTATTHKTRGTKMARKTQKTRHTNKK